MRGMDRHDGEVSASGLADTKQAGGKRRQWPDALKREVLAALSEPSASVSMVARRYDVNANQLFKWRREFGGSSDRVATEPVRLLPVEIGSPLATPGPVALADPQPGPALARPTKPILGSIEISLAGGVRVRIRGAVDPSVVSAAVGAVMAARRRR
jgi:transposase